MLYFYIPEEICFAVFVVFPCTWLYYARFHLCFSVVVLLSGGQIFWLQFRRFGFDSRRYQIFWQIMGLERGPLSLVSTTEKLLERNSSGSGLEIREYGLRDPSRWPRRTLYPQKITLTSSTSSGRSVGTGCSPTKTMEFFHIWFTIRDSNSPNSEQKIRCITQLTSSISVWNRFVFYCPCSLFSVLIKCNGWAREISLRLSTELTQILVTNMAVQI
jgi:hypothetical protein